MQYKLSAPSKSFIIGEYLALTGGATIIANTNPRFQLSASPSSSLTLNNIHPDSPAGKFIFDNKIIFQTTQLNFDDPYNGKGGFGASSAQFLLAYQLNEILNNRTFAPNADVIERLLNCYQHYAQYKQGQTPSGADIIAQTSGLITLFDRNQQQLASHPWAFNNMGFLLLKTPNKLATHTHLLTINQTDTIDLACIANQAVNAFKQKQSVEFANAINHYWQALVKQKLTDDTTVDWVKQALTLPGVLAAKGCGALGADVLLLLINPCEIDMSQVKIWANTQSLLLIASESDIAVGMHTVCDL